MPYHRWAQHGQGRVERVERVAPRTFFVPDWGKVIQFGFYHPAQAHRYGGRDPEATLTRPKNTCRYPREVDTVEGELAFSRV